jgi:hypothetical protein
MKNITRLLFLILLISFLANLKTAAQENNSVIVSSSTILEKIGSLKLDSLQNGVRVYYNEGYISRAESLSNLVHDAISFLNDSLDINQTMRIAVLDSTSWEKVWPAPYGVPGITAGYPPIAIMPADAKGSAFKMFFSMKDHISLELRKQLKDTGYSWKEIAQTKVDLIVLHELGHVYHYAYGIGTPAEWFQEFIPSYFAYLYLHHKRSELAEIWDLVAHSVLEGYSPDHRTLEELERLNMKVGGADYSWYQERFAVKANDLVEKYGFSFLQEMKMMFPEGVGEMTPDAVLQKLDEEYPGFEKWGNSF